MERTRSGWARNWFWVLALALAGCGSGGAEGGTQEGTDPTEPPPDEGTEPSDPALDQALRPELADANVTPMPAPAGVDPNLFALGQALFFDKELSGNRNISCATCHHPTVGTGDGLPVSIGEGGAGRGAARVLADGVLIPRNAPPLFDLAEQNVMFWDRRVRRLGNGVLQTPEPALNGPNPAAGAIASQLTSALAAQAVFPLTSHAEMRGNPGTNELADAPDNLAVWAAIMDRLVGSGDGTVAGFDGYRTLFANAFPNVTDPQDFHIGHVGRAIAAFEGSAFATRQSPFDRYVAGDDRALSDTQKQGALLFFGRADCARCHDGPALTDLVPRAIGVPQVGPGKDFPGEDTGQAFVTGNPGDRYEFRTPSLRNVAVTGPWMHDGAYTTLRNAVVHYIDPPRSLRQYDASQLPPLFQGLVDRDVGRQDARAAAIENNVRNGVNLSPQEVDLLVAFLESLTDPRVLDLSDVIPAQVPSGLPLAD